MFLDEETGCAVGDFTVLSRRRWDYENNCAAIICYASTGLATSSTQLTELSEDIIERHKHLVQHLTIDNLNEILNYVISKLLKTKNKTNVQEPEQMSSHMVQLKKPAIHLKVFYQVNSMPSIDLIIQTMSEFRERIAEQTNIAFTVLPASSLHHFSTFLSICGIRHE